jgi:hypothetical protein
MNVQVRVRQRIPDGMIGPLRTENRERMARTAPNPAANHRAFQQTYLIFSVRAAIKPERFSGARAMDSLFGHSFLLSARSLGSAR